MPPTQTALPAAASCTAVGTLKPRESQGDEAARMPFTGKRGARSPPAKKSLQLCQDDMDPFLTLTPEQKRQIVSLAQRL